MLRSRRLKREEPLELNIPDFIVSREEGPEDEVVLADSVGLALLVVLDTLTPAERLAFVLHDMFALPLAAERGSGLVLHRTIVVLVIARMMSLWVKPGQFGP